MVDVAKVRALMEMMRNIALHLTNEEINQIGFIVNKAIDRLENKNGSKR
jgi:hypothetical protein